LVVHLIFSVAKNDLSTAVFSHEAAGIVSSVGSEIKGVAVRDRIIAALIQFCGTRKDFTAGRTFDCLNPATTFRGTESARISKNGTTMGQAFGIDECTERVLMHENQPAVVNKENPFPYAVSRVHRCSPAGRRYEGVTNAATSSTAVPPYLNSASARAESRDQQ
jgi:Zn-dependent alcohol dehydrogenase